MGAVNTTITDEECQHVTGRFKAVRMLLSMQTGWPTFVQSHPSVKTAEWLKINCYIISPSIGWEKVSDLRKA